jgi:hypothetical protein
MSDPINLPNTACRVCGAGLHPSGCDSINLGDYLICDMCADDFKIVEPPKDQGND